MTGPRHRKPTGSSPLSPLRLNGIDELREAIPYLLGFHPERSLIFLIIEDGTIQVTGRYDAPTDSAGADQFVSVAATAHRRVGGGTMLVLYCDSVHIDPADRAASQDICLAATHALERAQEFEMQMTRGLAVEGVSSQWHWPPADWLSSITAEPTTVSDLELAAVVRGRPMYRRRGDIEGMLEPIMGPRRADVAAIIEHLDKLRIGACALSNAAGEILRRHAEARDDGTRLPHLSPEDVAVCALAVTSIRARDLLIATVARHPKGIVDEIWLYATRLVPTRYVAPVATMLATGAYLRGNGVLAGCALDAALRAEPTYNLARLLDTAIRTALPPEELATVLQMGVNPSTLH